jgi:hypothetical protein
MTAFYITYQTSFISIKIIHYLSRNSQRDKSKNRIR